MPIDPHTAIAERLRGAAPRPRRKKFARTFVRVSDYPCQDLQPNQPIVVSVRFSILVNGDRGVNVPHPVRWCEAVLAITASRPQVL